MRRKTNNFKPLPKGLVKHGGEAPRQQAPKRSLEECLLQAVGYRPGNAKISKAQQDALALHRHVGVSDELLLRHLGAHFAGYYSLPDGYCYAVKGGKRPAFWYGTEFPQGTPTLVGAELLKAVRGVLNLPYPFGNPLEATTVPTRKLTTMLDRLGELRKRLGKKRSA